MTHECRRLHDHNRTLGSVTPDHEVSRLALGQTAPRGLMWKSSKTFLKSRSWRKRRGAGRARESYLAT